MKYCELTEYNKENTKPNVSDSIVMPRLIKSVGPVETFGADNQQFFIFFLNEGNSCWYFISNKDKSKLHGFMRTEHVANDIWQVREVSVNPTGIGLGSSLYYFVVRIGNTQVGLTTKKLINDLQLSPAAEKVWNSSIFKKGLNRRVYDRHLNKIYDETDIGKQTQDGVEILNPERDTIDFAKDVSGDTMRFFWLAESKDNQFEFNKLRYRCLTEEFTEELFQETLKTQNPRGFRSAYVWVESGEY
ncbi:MAG: hypothetical protein HC836_40680 [Richelia sp. RM2_1_2]|nr:hypothetical protein [Richelia sp. RM2_1_2]